MIEIGFVWQNRMDQSGAVAFTGTPPGNCSSTTLGSFRRIHVSPSIGSSDRLMRTYRRGPLRSRGHAPQRRRDGGERDGDDPERQAQQLARAVPREGGERFPMERQALALGDELRDLVEALEQG